MMYQQNINSGTPPCKLTMSYRSHVMCSPFYEAPQVSMATSRWEQNKGDGCLEHPSFILDCLRFHQVPFPASQQLSHELPF